MGHERENATVDNFVCCLLVELQLTEGNKDDGISFRTKFIHANEYSHGKKVKRLLN